MPSFRSPTPNLYNVMHRRLPVYLLIDCSESMIGEGLAAVRSGLSQMLSVLRQDPHALETAWISIISFGATAKVLSPLTEVTEVQEPNLVLGQGTSLGAALDLLAKQIQSEVQKSSADHKGDYRPLVILLTDGQPTDDWEAAKRRFDQTMKKTVANMYVVGCGQAIDYRALSKISDIVLSLPDMEPESMRKLFVWMTQTVSTASVGTTGPEADEVPGMEILPKEITRVKSGGADMPGASMQVFLPSICSLKKDRYLMRYVKDEGASKYMGVNAHKIDPSEIESGGIKSLDQQEKVSLGGGVPCPYCEAEGWVQCASCGIHYCAGSLMQMEQVTENMETTCPSCNASLTLMSGGDKFDADFSRG